MGRFGWKLSVFWNARGAFSVFRVVSPLILVTRPYYSTSTSYAHSDSHSDYPYILCEIGVCGRLDAAPTGAWMAPR